MLDIVHPDDQKKTVERLQSCVSQPGVPLPRTESRAKHKDGSWRWMDTTVTSMLHDPIIDGIVVNCRDITERKLAEELTKATEDKYRLFFENSMDGILLTDPDGNIAAANAAACGIFQMTEEELCRVGRKGIVDFSDPRHLVRLEERRHTGKTKGEVTFIRGDGSTFPGEITSVNFKDASGNECTSTIIRDVTERKKAEHDLIVTSRALEEAWNDLKKTMDSSLDVICTVDAKGHFIAISSACQRMWGYHPDELCGRKTMDLVYDQDVVLTIQVAREVMRGTPVTTFENRYVRKDGSIVPLLWSARWDEADQVMYCIAKDATEKKKLEGAFKSERQRFYDMFLHAPSSLGIFRGPEHVFELANDQYLELMGRQHVLGKTVKTVFPEAENQELFAMLDHVYKTGKTVRAKERPLEITKHGKKHLYYLNYMIQPYRNSENVIDGIFFFAINVTEQVLSRKKIELREKQFRQIVETAQEGIWMLDRNNRTKFVNSKMCEILGYTEKEMIGRPTTDFMVKDNLKANNFSAGIETTIEVYEDRVFKKDGNEVWINLSTNPILDDKGLYNGALAMVTDVTERKRLQEKIVRQKVQQQKEITKAALQVQEKERNHLGSELHDNINQILTAVKLYLKHFLDNPDSPRDIVENSHQYLTNAIEEIRSLSQNLVTHRFDAYSFLEVLRSFLEKLPIRNNIELDTTELNETGIHENIKLTLFRIVQEHLNNVVKYANASSVTIRIYNDDKIVALLIRDNGIGFDLQQKRKGVGIINIHNRVESFNGTIDLQSSPGNGCSLSLRIPLVQPLSPLVLI
jgi:PAS domain S-box-containing protein